jgi:hypothetical protein
MAYILKNYQCPVRVPSRFWARERFLDNDSNSIEHFPYTARRRWHFDVAQSHTTVESIDDSVDDRRRRADRAGLTRTLDAQWVGCRRHVMG